MRHSGARSQADGASKSAASFWKAFLGWAVALTAVVAAGIVVYRATVADDTAQTGGDQPVVTESRDSPEPSDTAVQLEEERQAETRISDGVEVVATTPTTSPPTTIPEPQDPEDGQETGTEGDPEGETTEDPEEGTEGDDPEGEPQDPEDGQETGTEGDPEGETTEDPEEGTEGDDPEGEPQDPEEGQETGTEGEPEDEATEDPEEGTEGDDSEGEPQDPEDGQEEAIPDPVRPNQSWLDHHESVSTFFEECGGWEGSGDEYGRCNNPEDTQTFVQMKSDFLGCSYSLDLSRCEGYTHREYGELRSNLACGTSGWYLDRVRGEYWCFPPNYEQ